MSVDLDQGAEDKQSLANPRAAVATKPAIAQLIVAVLLPFPHGLTTREITELTGMTSYNTSGKLSKLAAYGVIEKLTITGDYRHRWRVKLGNAAELHDGPRLQPPVALNIAKLPGLLHKD